MKLKALSLLATLTLLGSSCGSRSETTEYPRPCSVPRFPSAPLVEYTTDCLSNSNPEERLVCMSIQTVVALGVWVRDVARYHQDVASCPWVKEREVVPFDRSRRTHTPTPTLPSENPNPFVPDTYDLMPIAMAMLYPGVEVSVEWRKCGEVNGYYYPAARHIVLCEELKAKTSPAFIRFVMAHEMAHAVIMQLGIAYTGSGEVAADEFAAVNLSLLGHSADVLEVAKRFLDRAAPETPWDDHPGDVRRGLTLRCLANGWIHRDEDGSCPEEWHRVVRAWRILLGAVDPA